MANHFVLNIVLRFLSFTIFASCTTTVCSSFRTLVHCLLFLAFLFSLSLRERSFPYTYTDLQNFLSRIMAQRLPWLQRERLANTLEKRRLDLLTISSPENLAEGADLSGVCCAFVSARVHPGETPSSYVMEGLLGFLLSEDPAAVGLRRRVVIKVVPMLNPDGVVLGNYRCSTVGQDLNRCVSTPHTPPHPPCLSSLWLTFSNRMNTFRGKKRMNIASLQRYQNGTHARTLYYPLNTPSHISSRFATSVQALPAAQTMVPS